MSDPASLPPGFRFHPTDEELILHYLRHQVALLPCPVSIIAEVDIYKFDPWDLPAKAMFGEQEWYFFSPRDRKYPNGVRPNRAAATGYWKATGTDKPIHASQGGEHIGVKKALVFYKGRPPKGRKTNWIMHEFRLAPTQTSNSYKPMKFKDTSMRLDDWVLCRIYKKNNSLQSVPPLVDQEQEDSGSRDIYFSSSQNMEQSGSLRLQKSFSVSDFLEGYPAPPHLFDDLPKMQGSELGLLMGQPSINQLLADNNNNNNSSSSSDDNYKLVQQRLLQEASLASVAASPTKRPRMTEPNYHLEGMNEILHPLKKPNDATVYTTEFSNQFDSIPCNLLNQSFFNQQILLNSHLGLR